MFDVYNWDFDGYCADQLARFSDLPDDLGILGPPEGSLVARLKADLVGCLQLIDSVDRSDEFWKGRNHLPTVSKLADFARTQLERPAPRSVFAWYQLAVGVQSWSCHLPTAAVWTLEQPARIDTRWLVEAGYLERAFWGEDAGSMRPVAESLGRLAEYDTGVHSLRDSKEGTVQTWVEAEGRLTGR